MQHAGLNMATYESAWTYFLTAASGVYSKLEQGAKTNGKSQAWYGRVKHERRKDQLLSYLHHARNTEEHSLESSADQVGITMTPANPLVRIEGDTIYLPQNMKPGPIANFKAPYLRLLDVKDNLHGDVFKVPENHLGQKIVDNSPLGVAKLGLGYLETLVMAADLLAG